MQATSSCNMAGAVIGAAEECRFVVRWCCGGWCLQSLARVEGVTVVES